MDKSIIEELVNELGVHKNIPIADDHPNRLVPNVYIAGTECVGKSTLFNLLLGVNKAEVSEVPLDVDIKVDGLWSNALRFIDGITYKGNYRDFGNSMRYADIFVQVYNIQSIRRFDYDLTKSLNDSKMPFVVALNKVDTIMTYKKRFTIKSKLEKNIGREVLLISAQTGENVSELVYSIAQLLEGDEKIEFVETLARHGKILKKANTDKQRRKKCSKIIQDYIRQITKVSSEDASGLTKIVFLQSDMIKAIADVYNVNTPPEVVEGRIKHIIRSAIHTLSQHIPLVGDKVSVISAIVWTSSIGNTAIELFENKITKTHIDETLNLYSGKHY